MPKSEFSTPAVTILHDWPPAALANRSASHRTEFAIACRKQGRYFPSFADAEQWWPLAASFRDARILRHQHPAPVRTVAVIKALPPGLNTLAGWEWAAWGTSTAPPVPASSHDLLGSDETTRVEAAVHSCRYCGEEIPQHPARPGVERCPKCNGTEVEEPAIQSCLKCGEEIHPDEDPAMNHCRFFGDNS
jgi:hypothetical protein